MECFSPEHTFIPILGTFGKAPWRPQQDLYPGLCTSITHSGVKLHENPYATLDTDSDHEEDLSHHLTADLDIGVYEQPFESNRMVSSQPCS